MKKSRNLKAKNNSNLKKTQKKKLEKFKEDKEKAILLSKSIETLSQYKIGDDAYSLLRSSRNLGQVETTKEKRRREVQYSKAGLEVPCDDRPLKKKIPKSTLCDGEQESDEMPSTFIANDSILQSSVSKTNLALDTSSCVETSHGQNKPHALNGDSVTASRHATDEDDKPLKPECLQNRLSTSSCHDDETTALKLGADKVQTANLADIPPQMSLNTPTVVHVFRPKEVENKRKDLPIVMMEQEIMEAINENNCVIICGETGCGKTTQVPQFLFEAGYGSHCDNGRGGIIGVTQPRRVAVLATAKRVAFELGFRLGKEVGFQVRHDRKVGNNSSIKFMTDGILLREVQNDFLLRRYSVIILDEAHERSLNTDILVGMLSRVMRERQREYVEQQKRIMSGDTVNCQEKIYPLKTVLMSATLRVDDFISGGRIFFEPPPVIEVPTRQYPVTTHFSKKTDIIDYVGQAYKKVLSIHKRLPAGGILVFVTGQREVEFLCKMLRKASKDIVEKNFKANNEKLSLNAANATEENDMKEISEAFEANENSSYEITDRFNSYGEDHGETYEDESDMSYDSEDDSDLEVYSDGEDMSTQNSLESDGKLAVSLGEDGNLASLKAAFEALAGKRTSASACTRGEVVPLTTAESESNASGSHLSDNVVASNAPCAGPMCVLPLYAMLPASAQLRVFDEVKDGERLVVVATNVAETSLTIPGIKYVVDTGREKVKNYNSSNGVESYEVQWISKASAAQRAGRAGRTGPGHCYRLYSSAVFNNMFSPFSDAEILKVPVDGVVLLMKSMHIGKVANFPFPTPPEPTALIEAERCLKVLEALDVKGRLTPLGTAMAQFPMSPRHSRMLLTVIQMMRKVKDYGRANTVLAYAVAAAAALSLSNPFLMEFQQTQTDSDGLKHEGETSAEKEEKMRKKKLKEAAKVSRAKFSNPTSDALTIAFALQCFELSGNTVVFCSENALHLKTMEEMSKLRKQLLHLVFNSKCEMKDFSWTHGTIEDVEGAWRACSVKHSLQLNEEEILRQAIYAGWADRVAKRTRGVSGLSEGDRKVNSARYQACMVKETVFLHRGSFVSKFAPEFLVYSELLHSKRLYIHGATSVKANWLVKYGQSLCSFSAPLSDPKPYYDPLADQVFCWVNVTFGPHLWELPQHPLPISDSTKRVVVFAYALLEGQVLPCLKSVQKFMAAPPASILRPEALGQKRVGNLLNRLNSKAGTIDSRAKLKELWEMNPRALYSEVMDWFQEGFHDQFKELWAKMLLEVGLQPEKRHSKKLKRRA